MSLHDRILTEGHPSPFRWNSWNAYGCGTAPATRALNFQARTHCDTDINEDKILAAANQFESLGLAKAGYQYINIDVRTLHLPLAVARSAHLRLLPQDCWSVKTRDASTGRIIPDPDKFPDGISGVASQVHALGLKFGIYRCDQRSVVSPHTHFLVVMQGPIPARAILAPWATRTWTRRPSPSGAWTVSAFIAHIWGSRMANPLTGRRSQVWCVGLVPCPSDGVLLSADNCNVPSNWSDASVCPSAAHVRPVFR